MAGKRVVEDRMEECLVGEVEVEGRKRGAGVQSRPWG
jgi:hypothetical protein